LSPLDEKLMILRPLRKRLAASRMCAHGDGITAKRYQTRYW
jgi:hypothetical protein